MSIHGLRLPIYPTTFRTPMSLSEFYQLSYRWCLVFRTPAILPFTVDAIALTGHRNYLFSARAMNGLYVVVAEFLPFLSETSGLFFASILFGIPVKHPHHQ
jgi:hypothetical protein